MWPPVNTTNWLTVLEQSYHVMNSWFFFVQSSRGTGKVHSFGKRDHAIKRNLNIPVVVRGWLYKQVSWCSSALIASLKQRLHASRSAHFNQNMFKSVTLWNISYISHIKISFCAGSAIPHCKTFVAVWQRDSLHHCCDCFPTISSLLLFLCGSSFPCVWSLNLCKIQCYVNCNI